MEKATTRHQVADKISAISWGVFFIWIGVIMSADVPPGWALLILGAITLGAQVARSSFGLDREGFWLIVGALFLLGGAWQLFDVQLQLVPALLIGAGVAVILTRLWPDRRKGAS